MITVEDIFTYIDSFAPFGSALKWDNSGLLIGDKKAKLTNVLVTLDITNQTIEEAIRKNVNLIISHHPVIFHPLQSILADSPAYKLVQNGIHAICAHTNLDMAQNGVNDVLIETLGLEKLNHCLETTQRQAYKQVVAFVPTPYAEAVYEAMCCAGGGEQGPYKNCAFFGKGQGRFVPQVELNPFLGEIGEAEQVEETRLEMLVKPTNISAVISAMKQVHPYEEPAYQIIENNALYETKGIGALCETETAMTASQMAEHIKRKLGCTVVRYVDGRNVIKRVAVCSGGGSSYLDTAISMGADALIAGDFKHDQFVTAQNAGISVFDAGHFHSENLIVRVLQQKLEKQFPTLTVLESETSIDPVSYQ